jgi:hypothetical protein
VNHLTKDHKGNLSLLYYDFNGANQRIMAKKSQNLADSVILEEAEEPAPGAVMLVIGEVDLEQYDQDQDQQQQHKTGTQTSLQIPLLPDVRSRHGVANETTTTM